MEYPIINLTFYKTKHKSYLFKLSSNFGEIIVNDDIKISHTTYGDKDFELAVEPKKVVKSMTRSRIKYYENNEKKKLIPEVYESKKLKLLEKCDVENGEQVFVNLDEEYAYKKFLREWNNPVYEYITDLIPINFNIANYIYSEYKQIKPYATYGGELDDPSCICFLDPVSILKDICADLNIPVIADKQERPVGYSYVMELPSHSGVRYAKLNTQYIFSGYEKGSNYRGSYSDCVSELKKYKQGIYDCVKAALKNETEKDLSKSERRELCSQLTSILTLLQSVESTKRTSSAYYKAKENINKTLKTLQGLP